MPTRPTADLVLTDERRAAAADLKLCIISAAEADVDTGTWRLDPFTLDLIDDSTVILVNKVDAHPLPPPSLAALRDSLAAAGKTWIGSDSADGGIRAVSVKEGTGLRELADSLKDLLKHR